MAFQSDISSAAAFRAGYQCEVCKVDLYDPNPKAVVKYVIHSGTGLHLTDGYENYLVTDPPTLLKDMKNRYLSGGLFAQQLKGRTDDAFCLCPTCHRNIHSIAVSETKSVMDEHKGRMAIPILLLDITVYSIEEGNSTWFWE